MHDPAAAAAAAAPGEHHAIPGGARGAAALNQELTAALRVLKNAAVAPAPAALLP